MSRDIRQYWQEVRELEATLDEFVWLASASEAEARFVTEVPAAVAARLLRRKSHRVATEAEVAGHLERERANHKRAREEAMRRQGRSLVVVD